MLETNGTISVNPKSKLGDGSALRSHLQEAAGSGMV
ncbi:hypothetical protein ABIB14_000192 [Arthrobacter sp. UYEF3]